MAKRAQNLVRKGSGFKPESVDLGSRPGQVLSPFGQNGQYGPAGQTGQKGSRPGSDLLRTYVYTVGNWPKPVQDWPGLVRMAKMAILTTFGRS